jgi:general secretion pathway protein L
MKTIPLSAIENFFNWWGRQMADLLLPVTARFVARVPDALLIMLDPALPGHVRLLHRRGARVIPDKTIPASGDTETWRRALGRGRGELVVLALAAPLLLRRVVLPLAAEPNLDRVLGYEMDRLTPFAAADVFYTHKVLTRDRSKGQVCAELAVIPRTWVGDLVDRLTDAGASPAWLEAPGPDGIPRQIPLSHEAPARAARGLTRLGWIVCAVLAAAIVAVPPIRQSMALGEVEAQIELLRPRVEQAEALRTRIAANTSGAGQIAAARRDATAVLRILALLTDLLPDDTWLTGLRLNGHKATLEGVSATATKLIGALAAEPTLKNPAFAAPVVRSPSGADIFTIQAEFGL